MKNRKYYLIAIVAILLLLVGTLAASSKATPTNILYPVKLNVWEKMVGITKSGESAKADYALVLAEKRLQELQVLKEENSLTTAGGLRARDNFNDQTITTQNIILNLTQKEGYNSKKVLELSETLNVDIETAKGIFNLDQLEVLPEGAPLPKATSTPVKIIKKTK